MLDVKLYDQTYTFLFSLLSGAVLGIIYTIFKCLRKAFDNRKLPTVISDVIYMLIFTAMTCLFSIGFTDGFVRFFVVIDELIGFLAIKFTVGHIFYKLFEYVFKIFSKIKVIFQKNISVFAKKLLKASHKMLYNIENKRTNLVNSKKGVR